MSKRKRILSVLLAAILLLGVFAAAPVTANARITFDPPDADDVAAAVADRNIPKPKNLRVVATSSDSVTLSWKYENWGYSIAYTTDPYEEPYWSDSYTTRTNDSKEDWEVDVDGLTLGKTYYIYVRHATIDVVKGWLTYLGGETSMVKVTVKLSNTITVKTAACTADVNKLKTASVTVKPLAISNAKGAVSVSAIPSGTDAAIRSKITVNKTTGAITLKKGSYKPGAYKILLSVTAAGNSSYKGKYILKSVTVRIKASNPITVTAGARKIKQSALKNAAVTIKPLTIAKAQGKVTVTKVKSGTTASIYNYITIDKTNGKITIRKGAYKKGTYAVRLNITAAGNALYKGKAITKTVKVTVY